MRVEMQNGQGKIVCRGVIAGLITKRDEQTGGQQDWA